MKTNILTHTLAAVIAVGIAIPAMAATSDAAKQTSSNARIASDKPEVKILFHHTAENPYDIRSLSWCGSLAIRVQVVPMTSKTIVVAYNTGDLHGAKITGSDPSRIGFVVCKAGKTALLCDILCLEKRENLLPNLVTRLSDKNEWRVALDLQNRGQLNTKTFARTSLTVSGDRYAYDASSVPSAR
ncbi:MAG: hypothetical protein WCD79_11750 [Chthoniobacteraceae bacterium]